MRDVIDQLSGFDDGSPDEYLDESVRQVLNRGREELRRRRVRRGLAGGGTALAVAALASAVYLATTPATSTHLTQRQATAPTPSVGSSRSVTSAPTGASRVAPAAAVELVAYSGRQLPGYTITHVPKGYVLQGISNAVLDVARKGDHSPLDSFIGKLVVMLNDHPGPKAGTPVSVSGHPGRIHRGTDKVAILTYSDGKHEVDVQCWGNIRLTDAQLVAFAEGVTVTPAAATAHG